MKETVEERYESLKVKERTGMALSTYKKLDEVFQDMSKVDFGRPQRVIWADILRAFFGES